MVENEMTRGGSKIAGNAVSLAVAGAAGMVFTLIQLGILSRVLHEELFGLFAALRGFSLLLSTLVLFGFPNALIRFIPSFQARGEPSRIVRLFFISAAVILLLSAGLYGGRGIWVRFIPHEAARLLDPGTVSWLLLASAAMAFKLLLYGAFNGMREMRLQMIMEVGYLGLLTGMISAAGNSITIELLFRMIFFLNAAVFAIGTPVLIAAARRATPAAAKGGKSGIVMPSFMPYLGGSILLSLVALAFTDFDRFVMSSVLPLSAISVFHIASRVNSVIKRFLGFPVIALQPEVTRVYEEGRGSELGAKIVLFTKVSVISSFLLAGWAALIGREIIILLAGEHYAGAYPVLLILLAGVPIAAYIAPLLSTMKALHYMRWAVICDFLWMAVYFGTFYFFVSAWDVAGMAAAQVTASVFQMTAAVALSRKEGFFGGAGKGTGRTAVFFAIVIPLGVIAAWSWGTWAAAAGVVFLPVLTRIFIVKAGVFESAESDAVRNMVPTAAGKRLAGWVLGV